MSDRVLPSASYARSKERLTAYFDGTARKAWIDLTSDTPVSGIRATVRAGRDSMRDTLLSWLPEDMHGQRLLDAGCGTGALAVEAARRGAAVTAVDVSSGLITVARQRAASELPGVEIDWRIGDMGAPGLGNFDHVVAMDSLIHYSLDDMVAAVASFEKRANTVSFTFAPASMALMAMHRIGKLFPRGNRSPAINPVYEDRLRIALGAAIPNALVTRDQRISSGFYTSHALMVEAP